MEKSQRAILIKMFFHLFFITSIKQTENNTQLCTYLISFYHDIDSFSSKKKHIRITRANRDDTKIYYDQENFLEKQIVKIYIVTFKYINSIKKLNLLKLKKKSATLSNSALICLLSRSLRFFFVPPHSLSKEEKKKQKQMRRKNLASYRFFFRNTITPM